MLLLSVCRSRSETLEVGCVCAFQMENCGLRELLGISREAFLILKREEPSENTSLSPLLSSTDVSLRKT